MKKIIYMCTMLVLCSFAGMAQKFALIDMEYILKNIPAYEMTNEQLAQLSEKWQGEVEAIQQEAQELKRKYFGAEGELYKKRESLMKPMQDEIYNAVKLISEEKGYQVVVDRASAMSIIFASPKIDISNEVLLKLGYSK